MMTLIAAALAAAAPAASTADAHAQHQRHGHAAHQQMMDCCKEMKGDCKDCYKDMDGKHAADGSEHDEHVHQ